MGQQLIFSRQGKAKPLTTDNLQINNDREFEI